MENLWTVFCGESNCSNNNKIPCDADLIFRTRSSSYTDSVLSLCFDILLFIMILFTIVFKKSLKSSNVRASTVYNNGEWDRGGKSDLRSHGVAMIELISMEVKVHGTIAYVSQSAWIQSGSIRENILLGSNFGNNKYQDTLDRCSLLKYLKLLPYGELTEIGSGGQKQRIQLARALYKDADIYLLDDPFSALDAHTALSLFNEYVIEALSTMTDLLVTHQVDFLHAFDSILFTKSEYTRVEIDEFGYTKQKKRDCCGFYKKSRVNKV